MNEKAKELRNYLCGLKNKETRSFFLAYAFVRGMPYRRLELTAHEQPKLTMIMTISGAPAEAIKAWLAVPATEAMLEQAASAREEFLRQKELRRVASVREHVPAEISA